MSYLLGVDIGGTKTALAIGDQDGTIIKKTKFSTPSSWQKTVDTIFDSIEALIQDYKPKAIGVSCGGPLDLKKGLICSPPNLPGWDQVPISQILSQKTGTPCYLENDANACALAEWKWGAGRGAQNMIFLTFSTGLGAGMILDGRLYYGADNLAGEVGHIRLSEEGPAGYGKRGSWEGFCSGGGISRHYEERYQKRLTCQQICQKADSGEKEAVEIITTSAHYLGRGLAILIDLLNPEKIVIGTIFSHKESLFRKEMEKVIRQEALEQSGSRCSVVPAALGESLGYLAAIGAAQNGVERSL